MCSESFSAAMAPEDKLFGLFVHLYMRNCHTIIINTCAHNVLSDSLAIILESIFNLVLETFPSVMLLSLLIAKFAQLLIVDIDGLLIVLFGERDKLRIN